VKVAVIADTHTNYTTSGVSRPIPEGVWPYLESADHILHGGDVTHPNVLDELAALAPVTAVMGNTDGWDVRDWGAEQEVELELGGIRIGMLHDSGPSRGRRERLRARFPHARVVVFAHSHLPWNEDTDGLLLFNPGSPTWKRRAPFPSMGLLWVEDGDVTGEVFPV
jgi:putative phosphoesterase